VDDRSKLCHVARNEIDDLIRDGITPTPEEIVELNSLGWQLVTREMRQYMSRGIPIQCGQHRLWPLTLQAQDWYMRVGCNLGGLSRYALGAAMAACYTDGDLFEMGECDAIKRAREFRRSLRVTDQELDCCMAEVIRQHEHHEDPPDNNDDDDQHSISIGDLSLQLATMCGDSVEFWERRCSHEYALNALYAAMNYANESGRALPTDPRIVATRRLGWCIEKIRRRHTEGNATDGE
jgi:hypothetical protein